MFPFPSTFSDVPMSNVNGNPVIVSCSAACVFLIPVDLTMFPPSGSGDAYSHPPPLSRLLSPLSESKQITPSQVPHFQMSPLLHPLVGQHILTVSQFSKEQVPP